MVLGSFLLAAPDPQWSTALRLVVLELSGRRAEERLASGVL